MNFNFFLFAVKRNNKLWLGIFYCYWLFSCSWCCCLCCCCCYLILLKFKWFDVVVGFCFYKLLKNEQFFVRSVNVGWMLESTSSSTTITSSDLIWSMIPLHLDTVDRYWQNGLGKFHRLHIGYYDKFSNFYRNFKLTKNNSHWI